MSGKSDNNQTASMLDFSGIKRVPVILQAEVAECGLACLAMVASFHGKRLDLAAVRKRFSTGLKGMNLQQMIEVADSLGLASRALKCPLEEAGHLSLPCVIHWDMNHFVVLTKVTSKHVMVNDPGKGRCQYGLDEFATHFTGVALELSPTQSFIREDERQRMRLGQLWSKLTGFKSALLALLGFSLLLQLFSLVSPYYMQWVVDEVLISQDVALLKVLALGFALIVLITVATTVARSWLVLRLSALFNMQLGVNLLHHLLRLPMSFFEKRHIGDLVSRFGSLANVRERITSGLVETTVDGLMSIAVLIMMFIYSIKLTVVVLIAVALYYLLRLSLYRPLHRTTEESIQASAKEQSNFLENVRGIQTIKLFTREAQRQSLWQNQYADVINADIRLGKLKIGFESSSKFLFGIENIVVVYIAAMTVMDGKMTVGMVLAFMAYKQQLTERATSFLEQLIEFRILRLHLDRISDIALHEQESCRDGDQLLEAPHGRLTVEGVSFSYGDAVPVLQEVSLVIEPGECIAIVGASGEGKSTLMKLMLGLLSPVSGRICLDGVDINTLGLTRYRRQIAAVMQNDTLFSGSVADNITFFDPEPNLLKMQKCAQLAAIDSEIRGFPMGYDSLVGDMGNQFSGGQMQRILLARALYQEPSVLFLDEATSHLDLDNETQISQQISKLPITRIIVAHRPETIRHADRVFALESGRVRDINVEEAISTNS
ncbi:peptidase domain-containing ABC transporter [Ferrimonas kyonanensis]|uniref:peptidase domain-containing ABC transporter n=1 Tax=Ferrimonas kyonanensis TaxID=364763 RepID=UPI000416DD2E|nr:peptidase domain-containing ABC transporter [Ferrimonas kyonanensis]